MRVLIQPDAKTAGVWAGRYVAKRIVDFEPTAKKPFVLGLPTGSTPLGMYRELIRLCKKGTVSFKNVVTFNMDEYVGLAREHDQSYYRFMWDNFFGHIDIKKSNANILNGLAKDLDRECERYEKKIEKYGGIELFIGGIGEDGHIAFNEPGSSLASRTRVKTLTEDTILVNARFFDGKTEEVPKLALTVGVGTVLDSREVLLIVIGAAKGRALRKVIEEGVNHMWTASALQTHPRSLIVTEEETVHDLKVSTCRYFRSVEAERLNPASVLKG